MRVTRSSRPHSLSLRVSLTCHSRLIGQPSGSAARGPGAPHGDAAPCSAWKDPLPWARYECAQLRGVSSCNPCNEPSKHELSSWPFCRTGCYLLHVPRPVGGRAGVQSRGSWLQSHPSTAPLRLWGGIVPQTDPRGQKEVPAGGEGAAACLWSVEARRSSQGGAEATEPDQQ